MTTNELNAGIIVGETRIAYFVRNQEIAKLFAEGFSRRWIGEQYGIKPRQVRRIVKRMAKLNAEA